MHQDVLSAHSMAKLWQAAPQSDRQNRHEQVIEARLSEGQALPVSHAAADVWSAGAVLFALLAGTPPFFRPSDAALPPQPKAVATLLRINTDGRNALHSQVSSTEAPIAAVDFGFQMQRCRRTPRWWPCFTFDGLQTYQTSKQL